MGVGFKSGWRARNNVTFNSQESADKSGHQWICLAAAGITAPTDDWTRLSGVFDAGEDGDRGSRTTLTEVGQTQADGWSEGGSLM